MPTYAFRCPGCGDLEQRHPMAAVPASVDCPACGAAAPRRFTSPALGRGSSPATAAMDAAARSASEPGVVSAPPPAGRRASRPVSRNPLHAKLPRP